MPPREACFFTQLCGLPSEAQSEHHTLFLFLISNYCHQLHKLVESTAGSQSPVTALPGFSAQQELSNGSNLQTYPSPKSSLRGGAGGRVVRWGTVVSIGRRPPVVGGGREVADGQSLPASPDCHVNIND